MTPDQLAEIEDQISLLSAEKEFGESEIRKLSEENAKLVGHQNPKQRIRYHYQVKEENIQLKQEVQRLKTQLQKTESQCKTLQKEMGVLLPLDNKENLSATNKLSLTGSFQTPVHRNFVITTASKKKPGIVTPSITNFNKSLH